MEAEVERRSRANFFDFQRKDFTTSHDAAAAGGKDRGSGGKDRGGKVRGCCSAMASSYSSSGGGGGGGFLLRLLPSSSSSSGGGGGGGTTRLRLRPGCTPPRRFIIIWRRRRRRLLLRLPPSSSSSGGGGGFGLPHATMEEARAAAPPAEAMCQPFRARRNRWCRRRCGRRTRAVAPRRRRQSRRALAGRALQVSNHRRARELLLLRRESILEEPHGRVGRLQLERLLLEEGGERRAGARDLLRHRQKRVLQVLLHALDRRRAVLSRLHVGGGAPVGDRDEVCRIVSKLGDARAERFEL